MGEHLAIRLFDSINLSEDERDAIEEELEQVLESLAIPYTTYGYDYYDCSLELNGVPDDYRFPEEALNALTEGAGFATIYLNHKDGWETHYNGPSSFPLGWRVSYPHHRGDPEGAIWVEAKPASWPDEWFTNGSVIVKEPQ